MYRFLFTPRWLGFHLLVIVVIVTMVNLGFWQLRRLNPKANVEAFVGFWIHSAEMRARTGLPLALSRFGLLPQAKAWQNTGRAEGGKKCGGGHSATQPADGHG